MKTIAQHRKARGYTQAALAAALGLGSATTVANWEQGRHDPTARQLRGLAILFGVGCEEVVLPTEDTAIEHKAGRPRKPAPEG